MVRIQPVLVITLTCAVLGAGGCGVPGSEYAKVERELLDVKEQVRKLQEQVAARDQALQILNSREARGFNLTPKELEELVVPVKIELERLSGGYDVDGEPGDDGLVLFVQPIDRDGDVVKAAGSIKVTLLDLANPPDQYLLGEYDFDVPTTRRLWEGRLWTNHFAVHCPWYKGKPPAHDMITARVEFLVLLTKQKLETQAVFKIQFPPGHVAGTGQ
jgi:hypothetical protein